MQGFDVEQLQVAASKLAQLAEQVDGAGHPREMPSVSEAGTSIRVAVDAALEWFTDYRQKLEELAA